MFLFYIVQSTWPPKQRLLPLVLHRLLVVCLLLEAGTPASALDTGAVSEASRKKKEGIDNWIKWFENTLKDGQCMDKSIMKEAAVVAVEAGVLSVQDSVGLEFADLFDFPGFATL